MSNQKTFRLFISSTFSDFKEERKVLQTKVFPDIKDYASKNGFVFQPIDLRWGVSNEAQLDQKTLELCLNEVRTCKTYIYPNFLIMAGDRYGWVPLPYAIERKEFEKIISHLNLVHKNNHYKILHPLANIKLLKKWYKLDSNQIPASYILKERKDKYEDFDNWNQVEEELRDILQKAVNYRILNEEQKRKYFLSATEAEVEEGIIPYIKPTKFQTDTLLNINADIVEIDKEHIFAFIRDVDKSSKIEDKFIGLLNKEATEFKQRVKDTLIEENTLHVETKQVDKETLDEIYLLEFETRMLKFLKSQIDEQKKQEEKSELTPLHVELSAQKYFAKNKRKNFTGQKELLKTIAEYTTNDNQEALVIYGKSGRGKSALMAKAIAETQKSTNSKVLFRFVGATPNSASSKEILTSILEELEVDIQSKEEKESFEDFSYRVYAKLQNIKEDVVIFIDAVDQLQNDDQFLWLPEILPSNVKIIISALEDENYEKDSKYFETLKTKTNDLHKILVFNEANELLETLLKEENRTIDEFQKNYFLEQYTKVQSPLYITIAIQEMKNWKSGDRTQILASTQKEIIQEFISNLTEFYHHNKEFVQKVLGYIYASRNGLSESELLQLLAQDEEFIKRMAPETWHENQNKELPLVHWSRLQTQLKPFLSVKTQDNEELMYFFHREFEDVVREQVNQREEHEAIIEAIQKLIVRNQDRKFDENRWGKFYAILITEYALMYNENYFKRVLDFIDSKIDISWLNYFSKYLLIQASIYNKYQDIKYTCIYTKLNMVISQENYERNGDKWEMYTMILRDLGNLRCSNITSEELLEKSYYIVKEKYSENPSNSIDAYIDSLHSLVVSYDEDEKKDKAINLEEEACEILEELFENNPSEYIDRYTRNLMRLASLYENQKFIEQSITIVDYLLDIFEEKYQYEQYLNKNYIEILNFKLFLLNNYSNQLQCKDNINKWLSTLYRLVKEFYVENPKYWHDNYVIMLEEIVAFYYSKKNWEKVKEYVLEWKNSYRYSSDIYKNKIIELNKILVQLDHWILEGQNAAK